MLEKVHGKLTLCVKCRIFTYRHITQLKPTCVILLGGVATEGFMCLPLEKQVNDM